VILSSLVLAACGDSTEDRVQRLEQRVQASEFQIAGMAELEPRVMKELEAKDKALQVQAKALEQSGATMTQSQKDQESFVRRLEMVEQWIQEKDKEEEKQKLYAWEDGQIPDPWKQLETQCGMDKIGESQTILNWLVRMGAYMSDFPVHHAVDLSSGDPTVFMTSPMAARAPSTKLAYRDMELDILKSRDQWLGYRIDRSWETRPEYGQCKSSCCRVDPQGNWDCQWTGMYERWGSEGNHSRWECEYDAEGWRDYKARWWRQCDYIPGSREFRTRPYLMKRVEETGADVRDPLYCVVDIIWENRIYCASHSQYPVLQVRMEDGTPESPLALPDYPRFTLLKISNWDVIYRDEWSFTWVVLGTTTPGFPGQRSGYKVEVVQTPTCASADNPSGVLRLMKEQKCMDPTEAKMELGNLVKKYGFKDEMDFEIQKTAMTQNKDWSKQIEKVLAEPCTP
jgi:hypothetical protein